MLIRHAYGIWLPVRASLACSPLHPLPNSRLAAGYYGRIRLPVLKTHAEMLNLKTAVGTTDFTDKEGIAVPGMFTRRVAAKEVLDHDEGRSHPCHTCYPRCLNCRI